MAITGVRVTRGDDEKTYTRGRGFDFDGYGDLMVRDTTGAIVATRKRGTFDEVELVETGEA